MSQLEFSQVVTRGGDRGESSLYSGERFRKDDLVFMTLGDLDECSAWLGLAKHGLDIGRRGDLETVQKVLGQIMAQVATLNHSLDGRFDLAGNLAWLEERIRDLLAATDIPAEFVLPGGTELSARLDLARVVCRRAERQLVALIRERGRSELALCQNFVNRLSDHLFILARHAEQPS